MQSLARLALVLERNGQVGTGPESQEIQEETQSPRGNPSGKPSLRAAAAATAVAAVVAKQGDDGIGQCLRLAARSLSWARAG